MVSGSIFKDSDKAALRDYGRKPIIMSHDLHERDMFSDEGLADLLERYPRDELGVYTMGDDPEDWRTFVKGEAGDLSGEELLKLAREGRIWFNLRAVDQHLEDYAELREQMFREFDSLTGQKNAAQRPGRPDFLTQGASLLSRRHTACVVVANTRRQKGMDVSEVAGICARRSA